MTKEMKTLHELCETLGNEYSVVTIDWEPVIYRDFNNGFDVEISGAASSKNKKVTIYLWHDTNMIVCRAGDVARENIQKTVDEMYHFTEQIIAKGRDKPEELRKMYSEWPLEYFLMNRPKIHPDDQYIWDGLKHEKVPDSAGVRKNKLIRIKAADAMKWGGKDNVYVAVYLDPNEYEDMRIPIRCFSPYRPHSIVWPDNDNGCCEGWPVLVTTNIKPGEGGINYSAQCACGGWCTNGHDTPQETVSEYWGMTQRKIEHPEYY